MVVYIDQVAPDIAKETGRAARDSPQKGAAVYAEIYGMVFFAVNPVLVFTGPSGSVIFVFAVEFLKAVRVRQACYFDLQKVIEIIQGSDMLPCDQTSGYIGYACAVIFFHKLFMPIRTL